MMYRPKVGDLARAINQFWVYGRSGTTDYATVERGMFLVYLGSENNEDGWMSDHFLFQGKLVWTSYYDEVFDRVRYFNAS